MEHPLVTVASGCAEKTRSSPGRYHARCGTSAQGGRRERWLAQEGRARASSPTGASGSPRCFAWGPQRLHPYSPATTTWSSSWTAPCTARGQRGRRREQHHQAHRGLPRRGQRVRRARVRRARVRRHLPQAPFDARRTSARRGATFDALCDPSWGYDGFRGRALQAAARAAPHAAAAAHSDAGRVHRAAVAQRHGRWGSRAPPGRRPHARRAPPRCPPQAAGGAVRRDGAHRRPRARVLCCGRSTARLYCGVLPDGAAGR